MKGLRFLWSVVLSMVLLVTVASLQPVAAQCSMCTLNAENATQGENAMGKGLNDGILFLLAIPYLAAAGIGLLWYTKYRKSAKKVSANSVL